MHISDIAGSPEPSGCHHRTDSSGRFCICDVQDEGENEALCSGQRGVLRVPMTSLESPVCGGLDGLRTVNVTACSKSVLNVHDILILVYFEQKYKCANILTSCSCFTP